MRHELSSNLLHNPFHNRFNVPVTHRRDSLQAHANVVWLHQRNERALSRATVAPTIDKQATTSSESDEAIRVFSEIGALLVVLISLFVLLRVF
jgi:hypothetical protein